jgi:hypothetical protein
MPCARPPTIDDEEEFLGPLLDDFFSSNNLIKGLWMKD